MVAAVGVVAWRWAPVTSAGADAGSDPAGEALADVSSGLLTPTAGIVAAGLVLIGGIAVVFVDAVRSRRYRTRRPAVAAPHHRAMDLAAEGTVDVVAEPPVVVAPAVVVETEAAARPAAPVYRNPPAEPAESLSESWPESWTRGPVAPIATAADLLFRTRLAAGLHDELFTHRDAPASGS